MDPIYFIYAYLGVLLCTGLVTLAFGYKLLRPLMTLYGVFLGGAIGYAISSAMASERWVLLIVGAVLGALALGFLFFYLYKVFLFLYGASFGAGLITHLLTEHLAGPVLILASLVAAVVSGLLLLKFLRPLTIVISSMSGALLSWMMLMILSTFPFEKTESAFERSSNIWTLILAHNLTPWMILGLFTVGALFQFMTTRSEGPSRHKFSRGKKVNTAEYSSPYAFLHEKGSK